MPARGKATPPSGGTPGVLQPAGTFTATASASGTSYLTLEGGFLTELSIRINGDLAQAASTGGPVKIEAWLRRGPMYRHLCKGWVSGEITVKGSGQLPIQPGAQIMVRWTNTTAAAVVIRVDAFVDSEARGDSAPGWIDETCPTRVTWTYTNRFTETGAGGGNQTLKVTPAANTAIVLRTVRIVMCDAAAGRATVVGTFDEDGASQSVWTALNLDNQKLAFPAPGSVATTADNAVYTYEFTIPGDGSYFGITVAAMAQNEYFDLLCCWELLGTQTAPTITHTSTGTASTGTATQNDISVFEVRV